MLRRLCPAAPVAGLLAVLVAVPAAPAAPPLGDEQETVAKVNAAIDRGVKYLLKSSKGAGGNHWESFWVNNIAGMDGGVTALAVLALLNSGESPDRDEVRQALAYLRGLPTRQRTYVVGLTTLAFAEARRPAEYGTVIQGNVDWLIKNAYRDRPDGPILGWSYPINESNRPDGSNTQYALLGLYAGKQAGAKIPDEVWRQLKRLYLDTQRKVGADEGYWPYIEFPLHESYTMTAAGVCGLLIADMGLAESPQGLDPATGVAARCGRYDTTDPVNRGLNYLGRKFNWDGKPDGKSTYYNVYGLERVGRLSGQRFLGAHDWYREGCDYLVRAQTPDGGWVSGRGPLVDGVTVISTSFALLFLSKGRTPVLLSKLAWGPAVAPAGGVLVEKTEPGGVVGWNRKHNDARHLTEFASRELFGGVPLGWQVYDPRRREFPKEQDVLAEVGALVQSPVLYLNGHTKPDLTGTQKQILKRYIEEGGFVLAEACCGAPEFAAGFRRLMTELFPDTPLRPLPPGHAVWRSYFDVPPGEFPKLEGLDRGCRTVVVFSPEPVAGFWDESKYMPAAKQPARNRGEFAFRLGANVIAYATGMELPKQRLTVRKLAGAGAGDVAPPRGAVKPAQLQLEGEAPPAPAAMRALMGYLRDAARLDVVLDKEVLRPNDENLDKFRFLYLHGRKRFHLEDAGIENVRANLQGGGLLFADACCGKPEFDAAFREFAVTLFPGQKLEVIPLDDDLYSGKLGGPPIRTVKRREQAGGAGPDAGFRELPPFLEGIKVDGRWAVIYSKYDIGCSLEGHKATDCLGHTRDSALQLGAAAVLYALKR